MKNAYKKFLVLVALTALVLLEASAATTGSIAISGSIPAIIELSVSSESVASNLPLTQTVSDLKVATVNERSNKKAGYTVVLESANAKSAGSSSPSLVSSETLDTLPYSIKYDGNAVTFTGGSAIVSDASAKTLASGVDKPVTVSFDGAAHFLDESVYGDTLTFTIIAK
jgi:hypothetical protein